MSKSVYVMASDAGPVKIGISDNASARAQTLSACQPYILKVCLEREVGALDPLKVERTAHRLLHAYKKRGEWFNVDVEVAKSAVELAVERVTAGLPELELPDDGTPKMSEYFIRLGMTLDMKTKIESWRAEQQKSTGTVPSFSEACRQLIKQGTAINGSDAG